MRGACGARRRAPAAPPPSLVTKVNCPWPDICSRYYLLYSNSGVYTILIYKLATPRKTFYSVPI